MRRPSILSLTTGLLLPALAACGSGAPEDAANMGTAPPQAAAPDNVTTPATAAAAAPAPLVLEGHGLRIAGGGAAEMLPFDSGKATTVAALTRALGGPPTELGANQECGGGGLEYAAWPGKITAWFEAGRFVGWDNKGAFRTGGGLGLGSRRADLARLPGFEVEQSTLGVEFRSGGLSGILESKSPDARVTDLWGGATCVFR